MPTNVTGAVIACGEEKGQPVAFESRTTNYSACTPALAPALARTQLASQWLFQLSISQLSCDKGQGLSTSLGHKTALPRKEKQQQMLLHAEGPPGVEPCEIDVIAECTYEWPHRACRGEDVLGPTPEWKVPASSFSLPRTGSLPSLTACCSYPIAEFCRIA